MHLFKHIQRTQSELDCPPRELLILKHMLGMNSLPRRIITIQPDKLLQGVAVPNQRRREAVRCQKRNGANKTRDDRVIKEQLIQPLLSDLCVQPVQS